MKIAVRGGHNPGATGAKALIDELTEDRKVKDSLIKYLKSLGHSVLDVTPTTNMSSSNDLAYGVNKANNWGADLFVSIHFNKAYDSYNGALGSEVCVYKENVTAKRVVDKLGKLGFKNRGQKIRTNLYELKHTNMSSMIVEVCFVEATKDVELYKKLGYDAIGKAIAEAIANKTITTSNTLKIGDIVTITGNTYATGQPISDWAKKQKHTISKIDKDRALLKEINSWCYLKDLKKA